MTRDEAITHACATVALAYHSIANYDRPSDGFCCACQEHCGVGWNYQNAGEAARFVRHAVLEKLQREGVTIDAGFDPTTGDPKKKEEQA